MRRVLRGLALCIVANMAVRASGSALFAGQARATGPSVFRLSQCWSSRGPGKGGLPLACQFPWGWGEASPAAGGEGWGGGLWGAARIAKSRRDMASDQGESAVEAREESLSPAPPTPTGEKQSEATIAYASQGKLSFAVKLIKAMREAKVAPSIPAYVHTIEACRRVMRYDHANALLSDMYAACMPEDLCSHYAADHPNDDTATHTARCFALLVMMKEDGEVPNEDTFRPMMGICTREGLWDVSLLLLEEARLNGIPMGKFMCDEICTALLDAGFGETATMIYERAIDAPDSEVQMDPVAQGRIDLHSLTLSAALATVRITLLDMVRQPANRSFHDPDRTLNIITGIGLHSKDGEAVIKPQVMKLLDDLELNPEVQSSNLGCIVLKPDDLQNYVERLKSMAASNGTPTDGRKQQQQ